MRTKEDNYTYNWVIDTLGNWAMQCLGKQTTFFKIEIEFKISISIYKGVLQNGKFSIWI